MVVECGEVKFCDDYKRIIMDDLRKRLEQLVEREGLAHLVKDHPWVAKDEYFKNNPDKCMTLVGYKAGAALLLDAVVEMQEVLERYKFISAEIPGATTQFSVAAEALASFEKRLRGEE